MPSRLAQDVVITDLANSADQQSLSQLLTLHGSLFPKHGHVLTELEENARLPTHRGHLVVHQFLAQVDDEPAGLIVAHTSLRRRIGLIHFLGVVETFRGANFGDRRISKKLVETACAQITTDGETHGISIDCGVVAESESHLLTTWGHLGFTPLAVEYAEPFFGKHWVDHGEPEFFPMTLVHQSASPAPKDEVATSATQAYLLDHYRLLPSNPIVAQALRRS